VLVPIADLIIFAKAQDERLSVWAQKLPIARGDSSNHERSFHGVDGP